MSDQPGRDQMRPGGGRGHGRASVFTAQRKPSQDLRQKYTQPTTAGEGWVGVGGLHSVVVSPAWKTFPVNAAVVPSPTAACF